MDFSACVHTEELRWLTVPWHCNHKDLLNKNVAVFPSPLRCSTIHLPLVPFGTMEKVKGATFPLFAVTMTAPAVVHIVWMLLVRVGQLSLKSSIWIAMVPVAVLEGKSVRGNKGMETGGTGQQLSGLFPFLV